MSENKNGNNGNGKTMKSSPSLNEIFKATTWLKKNAKELNRKKSEDIRQRMREEIGIDMTHYMLRKIIKAGELKISFSKDFSSKSRYRRTDRRVGKLEQLLVVVVQDLEVLYKAWDMGEPKSLEPAKKLLDDLFNLQPQEEDDDDDDDDDEQG